MVRPHRRSRKPESSAQRRERRLRADLRFAHRVLKLARASSVHHTATDGLAEAIRRCFCRGMFSSDKHGTPRQHLGPLPCRGGAGHARGLCCSCQGWH